MSRPQESFADLAVSLKLLADAQTFGNADLYELANRFAVVMGTPTYDAILTEHFRWAEALGEAHRIFKALAPFEKEVRALLDAAVTLQACAPRGGRTA